MSRLGKKISTDSKDFQVGKTYNVRRPTGEATVEVLEMALDGVKVKIISGGFAMPTKKYVKGNEVVLPYDSYFYEPTI